MVQIVKRNQREFSAFRTSLEELEEQKSQLEEQMRAMTLAEGASANVSGSALAESPSREDSLKTKKIEESLELGWILEFCDMIIDPNKFRQGSS